MAKQKPNAIRVEVPEEFGPVYDGEDGRQWVERRYRVSGQTGREMLGVAKKLDDEDQSKEVWETLSKVFTDWNLEGDDGALPKPWENPKAFAALFDSDWTLMLWVAGLVMQPVAELTDQKN